MLFVGTTDMDKQFHPFGISVSKTEQSRDYEFLFRSLQDGLKKLDLPPLEPIALMADGADAITNGFNLVFGKEYKRGMCWAHCRRANEKYLKQHTRKNEILEDLDKLQTSQSTNIFNLASQLFMNKYADEEEYVNYFKSEWITAHSGWYAGFIGEY